MSNGMNDYDKKVRVFFLGFIGLIVFEALIKSLVGPFSDLSISMQWCFIGFQCILTLAFAAVSVYALSIIYGEVRSLRKKC